MHAVANTYQHILQTYSSMSICKRNLRLNRLPTENVETGHGKNPRRYLVGTANVEYADLSPSPQGRQPRKTL